MKIQRWTVFGRFPLFFRVDKRAVLDEVRLLVHVAKKHAQDSAVDADRRLLLGALRFGFQDLGEVLRIHLLRLDDLQSKALKP